MTRKIPMRVAVLASGEGTNLQALLDRLNADAAAGARVELVVGSRGGIGALERAARAGVPAMVLSARALDEDEYTTALLEALADHRIDLVVLAGFLQLVPLAVVKRFSDRMINIHPALLPAFGGAGMFGMRVHQAVLESGARVTGATVHYVDDVYDSGTIIAQWPVPVLVGDTPERLAERVLRVEHRLLPEVVRAIALHEGQEAPEGPIAFRLEAGITLADSSMLSIAALPSR